MLELRNIKKDYVSNECKVEALKQINLSFRESEFVSILGPSGCGKTTLLNIIGGLDRFTDGDLVINGKSTKNYTDKDFDTYRNHEIGFVFQSYNLISHQTVLQNVELALTLSGVSKKERRQKAILALERVGLKSQIHKRPNQLSGGQMQRVAIARAIVNNPNIILADEPTGALDSKTSKQIMELLTSIAKDKLVIMVTHNEELANTYSTRIIKLFDGLVIEDSNPFDGKLKNNLKTYQNIKTSMSFLTACSLSLNNLLTKKWRTLLTSFAGSIGIIGIALILSLSSGVQSYIDRVQKDTLSTYPVSITETSVDTSSLVASLMESNEKNAHDLDKVYSNNIMTEMIKTMSSKVTTNNLKDFKKYIDNHSEIKKYVTDIQYGYDIPLQVYKNSSEVVKVNPSKVLEIMQYDNSQMMGMSNSPSLWQEMMSNEEFLKTQYDIVKGTWPKEKDEIVLIVDKNNEVSDYALYSLGLKDQKELLDIMNKVMKNEEIKLTETSYTYDDILNQTFKLILNTDYYVKDKNVWMNLENNDEHMKKVIENGLTLKIVGILRPNSSSKATSMTGTIGYLKSLSDYLRDSINEQAIVKEQLSKNTINVFTNKPFANMESLNDNLSLLGVSSSDSPKSINFYANSFDDKEKIIAFIDEYNNLMKKDQKEENIINYTDIVYAMMDGVSSIVDTISYVLIAFVTISLIVSSIMIGIITYISVLERTKEIGILRSIGASKKDIGRVFNAETMIIGLVAGLFGILVTMFLNVFVNILIKSWTDIANLSHLPIIGAIILIVISVLLTLIAGLIPSRIASKKDPVEALRSE